jgi:hypothetical protein
MISPFIFPPPPPQHTQRKTVVKGDFQVVKQDQDELVAVCKVMEDLIRMHTSIFLVSYFPKKECNSTAPPVITVEPLIRTPLYGETLMDGMQYVVLNTLLACTCT